VNEYIVNGKIRGEELITFHMFALFIKWWGAGAKAEAFDPQ
jgi:hypothetical protein